ncbi:MAG: GntP family permease, partial [Flammeovirgaceae bacterium]|nr:GntP family permease [Flammeovirgaceae bacterium]
MFIIILLILSVLFIILSTTKFQLHPFLALLFAAIGFGLFSGMPLSQIVQSINDGFGKTLGFIGIVIILGTIIGTFLENSGGAYAMAEKMLKIIGQKMVPLTMAIIGYVVSIPVFADSGFVILSPLNKALSKRAGISLAGSTVALAVGLTASHTLVPPTPGPIAAAGIIEADLGLVIMFGIPISILSVVVGWLFAKKIASKTYIDPNPELSEEAIFEKLKTAPSPFKAFIPILLPIVLIILKSVGDLPSKPFGEETLFEVMNFVGNPVIALLIGVLLSFSLPKKFDKQLLSTSGWVGKGLMDAAIIIMITGAGGAFGKVLQNSGIAGLLGDTLANANLGIWLPFV